MQGDPATGVFAKTVPIDPVFDFGSLHETPRIFSLDNAKKLIQNRPTPPPPPGGGGDSTFRANLQVQAKIKKIKKIDFECSMWNNPHDDK